ncbi:MAG: hypothetical protein ACI4BA_02540 [Prevotella sp.]
MKRKYATPQITVYETEHMQLLDFSNVIEGGGNGNGVSPHCINGEMFEEYQDY